MRREDKLVLLNSFFVAGMLIANFVGNKLMAVGPISLSVGTPLMALTFLCTDIITDVWGKRSAQRTVWLGFMVNLLAVVYTRFAVVVPHPVYWEGQPEFLAAFGSQWRLVVASLTSYLISQTIDVNLFHIIKKRTGESKLWIRNNLSTMTSQIFDTIIFTTLAFAGTVPLAVLIGMMVGQYGLRWLIALLDTPFCYIGVKWARGNRIDV